MRKANWLGIVALGVIGTGCAKPRGDSISEQRAHVQNMKVKTLEDLHAREPKAREKIEQAAGYGVFSNIGFTLFFVGWGNGYGVVVDKTTGKETYMRMLSGSAGLGLGGKDFRAVFVFNDKSVLDKFIESGWEFGAEGDASAKVSDTGGAATASSTFGKPIEVYRFTESGINLHGTVEGTKYRLDKYLND